MLTCFVLYRCWARSEKYELPHDSVRLSHSAAEIPPYVALHQYLENFRVYF